MSARHVRVTLEGVVLSENGPALRVKYGAPIGQLPAASVFVDTRLPGVTVEDVTPPRTWTDGDVVQSVRGNEAHVRGMPGWLPTADYIVDRHVADGSYRVLRYQAGE